MSDPFIDSMNIMNRNWWTLFNEIEKSIVKGDAGKAVFICQEAKTSLKKLIKENSPS